MLLEVDMDKQVFSSKGLLLEIMALWDSEKAESFGRDTGAGGVGGLIESSLCLLLPHHWLPMYDAGDLGSLESMLTMLWIFYLRCYAFITRHSSDIITLNRFSLSSS